MDYHSPLIPFGMTCKAQVEANQILNKYLDMVDEEFVGESVTFPVTKHSGYDKAKREQYIRIVIGLIRSYPGPISLVRKPGTYRITFVRKGLR